MVITRAELRTRARTLADQEKAKFPTDAQYDVWLEDGKREVWYALVTAGWPVQYSTYVITANGTAQYTIGAPGTVSVATVQAVYHVDGSTRREVPRLDPSDKASALSSTGATTAVGYEVRSSTTGTVIRLYPAAVTGSYEVEYLPEVVDFASDVDTWNGPARTETLIAQYAAARGCRKEGRNADARQLIEDYERLLERVIVNASWLDQRNAARIRDTRGYDVIPRRMPGDYDI